MIKLKKIKRFLSTFLASSLMLGMVSNATEITTNNISNEEVEIINQYVKGEKMLPEQIEARKNKAEELDLLEWVDENYFLFDDFYNGKSEADIEELGVNILVNTVTNEELDSWASNLKNGISLLTVTGYYPVSWGQSTVGRFEVDGRIAFCAEHSQTTPAKGAPTGQAILNNNELVRKVLYYGYGGPEQLADMTGNYGWVMTSLGLSKAYTGTGGTNATNFVNRVSNLPSPPSSFKVYIVQTNGGSTQDLAYWEYSPKGQLQIEKSSANSTITNNNNCYSLAGAVYGVYKNSNATNQVATLTTGADGKSQVIELDEGQYYVKEITPPKGFALDNTIYPITVNSGNLAVGKYTDIPQSDPVNILIKKVDSETGNSVAQGNSSLVNAEFTVKFYEGEYNDGVNPADLGVSPSRTWVLRTNENGFTYLSDSYKISGDDFYYLGTTRPTLPLGTLTIQETKAPVGYKINSEIFVRKITSDGTAESVNTYNEPIVKEEVIKGRIKVTKVDEETGEKLQGAEFELVDEATGEVVETLVTGADGTATSGLHPFARYILRETKAPDKFVLNGQEHFITISEDLVTIEVTHQNRKIKGRIEINKEDSEIAGLKLEGVKFGIFDENNSLVEELITNENGYAISGWLNYGDYIVRELETKDGYELNNQEWKVEIRADQKTYTYNITNDVIKGSIQIVKIDSQNAEKPVEGATFNIVAEDVFGVEAGTVVDTVTTDENGFAFTKELRYGEYYAIETSVGNDYWLNTNKYPITISEAGKVEVVHIKNEPVEMKLRVVKTDGETKEAIKGTKFKVVNKENGEDVEFTEFFGIIPYKKVVFTTDKNGEIVFPQKLSAGDYQLVETEPSEGYNAIEPIDFTINRDTNFEDITLLGKVTTIEVENTRIKGDVELIKLDTDSKEPMANVEFLVECLDGFDKGKTWTFFTDEDGIIKLEQFNYGKYQITEVNTLEGYVLNSEPIEFEITENGQKIELQMTNDRIKGDVELLKLDTDSKEPMANVEFLVECLDGFDKGKTWTFFTGEDGIIKLEQFNYGKYQITEVKTIEGYVLNTKPIEFEITENGQKIELQMTNDRIKGDMKLLKLDSKTGEPLANVRFKITGITGFNEGKEFKLYSNDYGIVELRDLEYGSYRIDEIETANGGYVLNTTPIYFEIRENGETVELEMTNDRIVGNMELLKVDADTKKPMAFVKFKVTAVDTFEMEQEYILESDNDGLIRLENLEAGVYRIDEIETLEGYILNTEPIFFTIQNNGETVQLEMENTIKKGRVELLKVDEDTNRPLQGITFELCKGDEVVGEYVTDENGKIVVENLPWGNYYWVEIATDDNYILDQDKFYDFFIEEDGQVIEITATNKVKEGEVDFSKTDVSTGELIEGATIHIKGQDEQNSHIDFEFVSTNEETRFKLPVGRYEFSETVAPEGFVLNEEVGYFEILENEVIKAELKNKRIEGILEFEKTDVSTGEVIEGALIKIGATCC
ncbi:MAG: SpaA isopeptide-forming pilin-related protein [uncultured Clostridium sp.]